MSQIELQDKRIEALKAFNNTISTGRLYPPDAPQITNATERGYKGVKEYSRDRGPLSFSVQTDSQSICGVRLGKEVVDSFANLIVFRQLRLLGLSQLVMGKDMDRFAFKQILSVFNASVKKIEERGGGREFITGLGLDSYFSDGVEEPEYTREESSLPPAPGKKVKTEKEFLAFLYGKEKTPEVEEILRQRMQDSEIAIEILASGVAHILHNIQSKKGLVHRSFTTMFENAEDLFAEERMASLAQGLGAFLLESLKTPALCVFLSQEFSGGFGETVYERTVSLMETDKISDVIILFREQLAKEQFSSGKDSPQVQFLGNSLRRLMNTPQGKQFIGSEKAKSIIQKGELERKKTRIEAGIKAILQGNLDSLKSDEFLMHLPDAIRHLYKRRDLTNVQVLLGKLIQRFEAENTEGRIQLLHCMTTIGENLATDEQWELLNDLLKPFVATIRRIPIEEALLERIAVVLLLVMQTSWRENNNKIGDTLLLLFYKIRTGEISNDKVVRSVIARVQDKGIKRSSLPGLLKQCLASPDDRAIANRFMYQGPVAVRFAIDFLIKVAELDNRFKILDLLSSCAEKLPPIIHEHLPGHMPWYGKRNLLKLLGETGSEDDAIEAVPYLKHDDLRVQREAFLTIYKIGGAQRKELFLKAFMDPCEVTQMQIISAFSGFCDDEVVSFLCTLLASHKHISDQNRNDYLVQLLETLNRCSSSVGYKEVQGFLKTRGQRQTKTLSEEVWTAAEKTIQHLDTNIKEEKKRVRQAGNIRKNAMKQVAAAGKKGQELRMITGLPQEQVIRTMLSSGDKDGAKNTLLQLIEKTCRAHNFIQTEKLREWLVSIDPMDIEHILQASEVIDEARSSAVDNGHLEIWENIYEKLTTDEFDRLHSSLEHQKMVYDEVIVRQGAIRNVLFFVNSGEVKLYFDGKDNEELVKIVKSGDVFGCGSFFDVSVWTLSAACLSKVELSVLDLEKIQEWKDTAPDLEAKLKEFCNKYETIEEIVERRSKDRRQYERHQIDGKVHAQMLDSNDKKMGLNSTAALSEISRGGLSCVVELTEGVNTRLLLGRKVQFLLPSGKKEGAVQEMGGDILAIKADRAGENHYCLHIRFDDAIGKLMLQNIVLASRRQK